MEANAIFQAIGTLGFPIAACIALFWQNYKLNESHKKEMEKITEAVNNNTIAITNLTTKINELERVKDNG